MDFRVKSRGHWRIFKLQTNLVINVECTQAKRLAVFLQFQAAPPPPSLPLSLSLSLFTKDTWYKGDYLKHLNSLYELSKGPLGFHQDGEWSNFFPILKINSLADSYQKYTSKNTRQFLLKILRLG